MTYDVMQRVATERVNDLEQRAFYWQRTTHQKFNHHAKHMHRTQIQTQCFNQIVLFAVARSNASAAATFKWQALETTCPPWHRRPIWSALPSPR
jgi:hypothetical protein